LHRAERADEQGAKQDDGYRAAVPDLAAEHLLPPPAAGRIYEASRRARFGDLSPGGRLRLDALGRYLQDVSGDDTADAGYEDLIPWVVRRLVVETHVEAEFRELLTMRTWCSGIGGRWAERRVSIHGEAGAHVEAAVLWVHIDVDSGQPRKLGDDFFVHYGDAAAGRKVGARLRHDGAVPAAAERRPWPTRFADFDLLRHVNNAVYLAAVEEALARRRDLRTPMRVEVEYRAPIEPDDEVVLATVHRPDGGLGLWVTDPAADTVYATAEVRRSD
jgi:acyl-ACP thioesterase